MRTSGFPFVIAIAAFCIAVQSAEMSERAKSIQDALKDADRIEVELNREFIEDDKAPEKKEIKGAGVIRKLVDSLDFDKVASGGYCWCDGDHVIRFYSGRKLIATLGHHHGKSLRWTRGQWHGDSTFTRDAGQYWVKWFSENGYPDFAAMRDKAVVEEKRAKAEYEAFVACYPPRTRVLFEDSRDDLIAFLTNEDGGGSKQEVSTKAQTLSALCESPKVMGMAICKSLGRLDTSWSQSDAKVRLALSASHLLTGAEFLSVLEALNDDSAGTLGAARLFYFERLGAKLTREQAAEWSLRLAEAALALANPENFPSIIRRVGSNSSPEATAFLRKLAGGDLVVRKVKKSQAGKEPSPQATALIMLAQRGDPETKALAAALETEKLSDSDLAALKIVRATLGEKGLITTEHFKIESYVIGLAAIAALEKEGGQNAVDLLVTAGLSHPWAAVGEEAVLAIERMTGQKWYQGRENERATRYSKKIREWWSANKDTFKPPAPKPK